ncbi:hypothetical protein CEXT_308301 [Caerostris extrusa]|uniref:Uncharacterized protein n=1 Tax=Caerostris extrusa TaxID=172846 RepID=A0AAV4TDU9_CAEEX|nr:hypothetical protein CEXT_308301 [Caerostris extrusa]
MCQLYLSEDMILAVGRMHPVQAAPVCTLASLATAHFLTADEHPNGERRPPNSNMTATHTSGSLHVYFETVSLRQQEGKALRNFNKVSPFGQMKVNNPCPLIAGVVIFHSLLEISERIPQNLSIPF